MSFPMTLFAINADSLEIYNQIKHLASIRKTEPSKALDSIFILEEISKQKNFPFLQANCANVAAFIYKEQRDFPNAQKKFEEVYAFHVKQGDTVKIVENLLHQGHMYGAMSWVSKAREKYTLALHWVSGSGFYKELGKIFNDLGTLYHTESNFEKAEEYYLKSLEYKEALNDTSFIATGWVNLGAIYDEMDLNSKALEYTTKATKYYQSRNHPHAVVCLMNLGNLYRDELHYPQAESAYLQSLEKAIEFNHSEQPSIYYNLAEFYKEQNRLAPDSFYKKAINAANQFNNLHILQMANKDLGEWYKTKKQFDSASKYLSLSHIYLDSLQQLNANRIAEEMKYKLDLENWQHEVQSLQAKNELQQVSLSRHKLKTILFSGGIFLLLVIISLLYFQFRQKRKSNNILTQKNEIIVKQNQNILEGMQYAKSIQKSLLFNFKEIDANFHDNFILFEPKELLSGDFYWFTCIENQKILIAADCTGHGVAGALMTMMGNTLLNQIIKEKRITQPAGILHELHHQLSINRDHNSLVSGMDLSICCIDENNSKLRFSSVGNGAILANGKTQILPANHHPLGLIRNKDPKYSETEMNFEKGSMLYMFSDGYIDQFGNVDGSKKKFGLKRLLTTLSMISEADCTVQLESLQNKMQNWQLGYPQLDDRMILGVRL